RNINIEKLISCSSLKTGNCPVGYEDPWRLEHNCPETLTPLESCLVDMYFIPLNQDPTSGFEEELEEIYYKGEINVEYDSTPFGKKSTLSGVFETNSTTIRARFSSSKGNILFPDPIVTGNYIVDILKIQNNGYREGQIRKIIFEKG